MIPMSTCQVTSSKSLIVLITPHDSDSPMHPRQETGQSPVASIITWCHNARESFGKPSVTRIISKRLRFPLSWKLMLSWYLIINMHSCNLCLLWCLEWQSAGDCKYSHNGDKGTSASTPRYHHADDNCRTHMSRSDLAAHTLICRQYSKILSSLLSFLSYLVCYGISTQP